MVATLERLEGIWRLVSVNIAHINAKLQDSEITKHNHKHKATPEDFAIVYRTK